MDSDLYWEPSFEHSPFLFHRSLAYALVCRVRPAEGATFQEHPGFLFRWVRSDADPARCFETERGWEIEVSALFVARLHAWFNAAVQIARIPPDARPTACRTAWTEIQSIIDKAGLDFEHAISRLLAYRTGTILPRPESNRIAMLAVAFIMAHEVGHLCCGHPQWLSRTHGTGVIQEGTSASKGNCSREDSLALELLADTTGCELLWHELSCEGYGAILASGMPGDVLAKQRAMFVSTKTSIRCLFMVFDRLFGTEDAAGTTTHPSGIVRALSMDAVMNSLQAVLTQGPLDAIEGEALNAFGYMASSGMFVEGGLQAALEYHRPLAVVRELLPESPALRPMAQLWKTTSKIQEDCRDIAPFPAAFTIVETTGADLWLANAAVLPARMVELMGKLLQRMPD